MNKNKLKAVLVDDEEESLHLLEKLISLYDNVEVISSISDSDQAVDFLMLEKPDIVFLDVKMPGSDGFDVIDKLYKKKSAIPYIVFTTAFDEFALKAFEYAAFDYLLKPIDPDRLSITIERCNNALAGGSSVQKTKKLLNVNHKLIYRNNSGILIIDPSDIAYVEADGNYCVFRFKNGKTETVTTQLGKVEECLPSDKFFRTSRAFIINLSLLKKIVYKKRECILQCNDMEFRCEISQANIKDLPGILNKKKLN